MFWQHWVFYPGPRFQSSATSPSMPKKHSINGLTIIISRYINTEGKRFYIDKLIMFHIDKNMYGFKIKMQQSLGNSSLSFWPKLKQL